jgi:hypothetical protein
VRPFYSEAFVCLPKLRRVLCTIAMSSTLFIGFSAAQQTLGSMNGTVTDSTGAVVTGAIVKARAVATNLEVAAETKNDGSFTIADLPIGTYEVKFSKENFETERRPLAGAAKPIPGKYDSLSEN